MTTFKGKSDFESFLDSQNSRNTPFSRLSADDMEYFKTTIEFTDDGIPYGYWGDIVRNERFNDSMLGDFVAEHFGIDKDAFLRRYHYFGNGNGGCTYRPYFNCPY